MPKWNASRTGEIKKKIFGGNDDLNLPKCYKQNKTKPKVPIHQETQQTPNRIKLRTYTPQYIKFFKDKNEFLKAATEMWFISYKKYPIWLTVYFSLETVKARKQRSDIVKMLKEKRVLARNLVSSKIILQNET